MEWNSSLPSKYQICGLLPYQQIQYEFKVANSAGASDSITTSIQTTNCAGMLVYVSIC